MYSVGMATWSETAGPPDLPRKPLPSPRCAALVSALFVGEPGGRNYTRDDPVLLSPPAFQVGLTFVGRVWS